MPIVSCMQGRPDRRYMIVHSINVDREFGLLNARNSDGDVHLVHLKTDKERFTSEGRGVQRTMTSSLGAGHEPCRGFTGSDDLITWLGASNRPILHLCLPRSILWGAVRQPWGTYLEKEKQMETWMWVVLAIVVVGGIAYYMTRKA
jgi:hypothetical protein